ncbi:MAG: DUF192 domain-containing protein [Actinomycetota bacterium]|nr:DUF192 domain-containing protein [Actinomycetota bacterium]
MPGQRLFLVLLAALVVGGCAANATSAGEDGTADPRVDAVPPRVSGSVPPLHPSVDDYPDGTIRLVAPSGQTVTVEAKVANTPPRRQHGLMEVPALPGGVGMLFVFPEDRGTGFLSSGGFWMKNTLVPLDVAFVGFDGEIKAILHMEPCTSWPCPVYDPGQPYRYALEVPGGWYEQVGVGLGWQLELPAGLPPSS